VADGAGRTLKGVSVFEIHGGKNFLKLCATRKSIRQHKKMRDFVLFFFLKFSRYYAEPAPNIKKKGKQNFKKS